MRNQTFLLRNLLVYVTCILTFGASAQTQIDYKNLARQIFSGEQDQFHVQGIAFDPVSKNLYLSFTTSLVKVDQQGNLIGSVINLTGHLGCMSYNPDDGRIYASLEYKHDVIGKGIMSGTNSVNSMEDAFYIAIFDGSKITRPNMDASEVMTSVYIKEAVDDYNAIVTNQGNQVEHRHGCSGIDGVAIGPKLGKSDGKNQIYIAYGVYGDKTRNDNNYQVILNYDIRKWKRYERTLNSQSLHHSGPKKANHKFFAWTGNTEWGIQNLAYDPNLHCLMAAVYRWKREGWENYDLYAIDTRQKPKKQTLNGIEPTMKGKVLPLLEQGYHDIQHNTWGWHFPWGSTGLNPLGNGYYYISKNARNKETKRQSSTVCLFRWTGDKKAPFEEVK